MMRAVVTGGAGFIGSHLVDALMRSGAEVLVVDDLSTGSEANLRHALDGGVVLAQADVRDGATLGRILAGFRPEQVFHLAAQIDVRASMGRPSWDASTNVVGTVNVLTAAAAAGVRRVVNTSSGGAVYGRPDTIPTPETEAPVPISAYGLSKRTAEKYCSWFRATRGLDCLILRYGNVYGPRQSPSGDAGVVARFGELALTGGRPVVYGDGHQTRDYVFVDDVVAANLAAAEASVEHDRFNIGTGVEVSVLDLAAEVARCAGLAPGVFAPTFLPARAGEVVRSCLDVRRANQELMLAPPTSLADGLRPTLAWLRARSGVALPR